MTVQDGIATATAVIQLAPAIIALIASLESLFPARKAGKIRKAAAMATIAHMPEEIKAGVSGMIDATVAAKNEVPVA